MGISKGFYEKHAKRLLDLVISFLGVTILLPIMVILFILGMIFMRGNPVFFQERPGKNGKIFKLIKFRTMDTRCNSDGNLLPDELRLNKYGRFLRSTSLDELPELINILKGDMSIVGPRPLLVSYLPLYNEHQSRRHNVKPGLTGYAQVNGRNSLTWEERFDLDVYYVDHVSFSMDLKIFFKTVATVLKREGISSETSETMEAFKGTPGR